MKRKTGYILLAAEGIIIAALQILGLNMPGTFTSTMAFPYEQLGSILRKLSLSGEAENAAAIGIYALISLLPAIYWMIFRMRKGFMAADILLPVMSASLFCGLYIMINPGYLPGGMGVEMERAVIGCALHSVWVSYAILRIMEYLRRGSCADMINWLQGFLWLLAAAFVYVICKELTGETGKSFANLAEKNTMPGLNLLPTQIFIVLGKINCIIPYIMDLPVIFAAMNLARDIQEDAFGEDAVRQAEILSIRCRRALTATVISTVSFNLLQLLSAPKLHIVDTALKIPVLSVIFALAALLAAEYIRAGQKLKSDNDLFI